MTNEQILEQARAISAAHALSVTLNSIADLNQTGETHWDDPRIKIIEVAVKYGPGAMNPGATFCDFFNAQSDADQFDSKTRADGNEVLFNRVLREGREYTRLLYIDAEDRGVLAEGAARIQDDDE